MLRKRLLIVSLMTLMICLFSSSLIYANESGVVTNNKVRVRTEPNTSSTILGSKNTNDVVMVISKEGDWYKLQLDNGQVGYMFAQYVRVDESKLLANATPQVTSPSPMTTPNPTLAETLAPAETVVTGDTIPTDGSTTSDGTQVADGTTSGVTPLADGSTASDGNTPVDSAILTSDPTIALVETVSSADVTRKELVDFALKHVGLSYSYGGTNLKKGVDCSGFALSVFKEFGYTLNRSSSAQSKNGISVAISDLKPGDLVFYGYSSSISHVSIYIGNGKIVHSSTKGKGVVTNTLYNMGSQKIIATRRIIAD